MVHKRYDGVCGIDWGIVMSVKGVEEAAKPTGLWGAGADCENVCVCLCVWGGGGSGGV